MAFQVSTTTGTGKGCRILPCNCRHEYQDKTYGIGQRVHNPGKPDSNGKSSYKCTVCDKQYQGSFASDTKASAPEPKSKKKKEDKGAKDKGDKKGKSKK